MLNFLCPRDGKTEDADFENPVLIEIPDKCCGIQIVISKDLHPRHGKCNQFDRNCIHHMGSWKQLWDNFAKQSIKITVGFNGPVICSKCNTKNEYAIPNQPDGSFICYGCKL